MSRLHPDVVADLEGAGSEPLDVIVTAAGDLDALLDSLPRGCEVRRVFKLRKGLAASATPEAVAALGASPHVASVEPDHPVQAMDT